VERNYLSIRNLDLPRKVIYKPRKNEKSIVKDPTWKEGRRYSDFLTLVKSGFIGISEMDTVFGTINDSKALLTLYFRDLHFMLAILLPDKTQNSVVKALDQLESDLGSCTFFDLFPVILTDNGTEFINPNLIEIGISGLKRTCLYYCDPGASWQKAGIEKNHEYIRYILPKGTSFESLTQEDVTLMMNHINSTARASLNGLAPIELAYSLFGKDTLEKLGYKKINPEDVILKPYLLKRN
jgi:IS30 family transposase